MVAPMTKRVALLLAMLATATTAHAGASNFTLVNATGTPLADLSIRRADQVRQSGLRIRHPCKGGGEGRRDLGRR
jgi:hypothetical protein